MLCDCIDEVGALVFDFGAHTCRAGFAGEDTPKVISYELTQHVTQSQTLCHWDRKVPRAMWCKPLSYLMYLAAKSLIDP